MPNDEENGSADDDWNRVYGVHRGLKCIVQVAPCHLASLSIVEEVQHAQVVDERTIW